MSGLGLATLYTLICAVGLLFLIFELDKRITKIEKKLEDKK